MASEPVARNSRREASFQRIIAADIAADRAHQIEEEIFGGGRVINQRVTAEYAMYHGDCVAVMRCLPSSSVHFSVFSPPFSSLYSYTDALQDMSNVRSHAEFFAGTDFMVAELARVTMPGRGLAFHCMNLPCTIEHDGYIYITNGNHRWAILKLLGYTHIPKIRILGFFDDKRFYKPGRRGLRFERAQRIGTF